MCMLHKKKKTHLAPISRNIAELIWEIYVEKRELKEIVFVFFFQNICSLPSRQLPSSLV